ncbi:translin-associated factor X-interacting protein 1 isoform X2 [Carlito syrichta]|uniref:Translin-associated factor X-interacting protein 1 isoform X2 n=1 Tax=Carlito syrichta TaxID=1868482 RepID=A0A3Q0E7B3_CARSF|nr:translin-associated factor X-interacting protein 1 isoform X2 [Carlito syrichta]
MGVTGHRKLQFPPAKRHGPLDSPPAPRAPVYPPTSVLVARVKSAVVTDSQGICSEVRVHLCYLAFLGTHGRKTRGRGATLTPPSSRGCWGLVAMATGCTLPQLPSPRLLAARLPEGHGLAAAVVLQLLLRVEITAWVFRSDYRQLLSPRSQEHPETQTFSETEDIAHQREKIRALEPLKAKLVTVNEDCNERILAMRAEEKYEISVLKKEKMNLLKLIDKKNEEKISLQSEVTKLRKNLAEEYLHYLTERDARKILIADLNELRYQREDMSLAQSPGVWGEDPVKLTLALKTARQDLTRTQMELNTMKANFGDVVPRRDFEMQEKTNRDLQEQEIQRTSTPRPDWSKCKDVVAGGLERWQMLAEGKNSDQLVDVLLEEIGEGLLREKDFFPALGYGEAIPTFLQYEGLVENKKPTKKEVINLLKDAWKERLAEEQKEKFPDFFFNFLEHRFGPSDAIAWAYTIFENIKLFRSSEVMSQFYAVLMGKWSESVYVNQKETIAQLLKDMTNVDTQNEGLLTMEQFSTILKNTFPLKKEEQIQELMEAGGWHPKSSDADLLNYRSLFMEDEEGQSEPFVQKLWEQYMNEKDNYLHDLKKELGLELHDEVNLSKLRRALMNTDSSLDKQTVNTYMSQAFQLPVSELPEEGDEMEAGIVVGLQTALERLQVIDIRRMGPREPEPAS